MDDFTADSAPPSSLPPLGLRVAATLCVVVGLVGALHVIAIETQLSSMPDAPRLPMVTNPVAVLAVLVAAVLIWKRRRLGAYLVIAGAILPDLVNLGYGQPVRPGGLLMIVTLITVAANWKELR